MIMTLYVSRNLSTKRLFPPSTPPSSPTPARSNHINTTLMLYRDRPVCSMTRQRRTRPDGAARRNRLGCCEKLWKCCESSATCQEKISPIATSLIYDHVAVAVAMMPLIVAADMSAVFPSRWVWYLLVGFILVALFYFIMSRAVLWLCSIWLQIRRFYSEYCNA